MSIPSPIGLPLELKLGEIDFSLPADARSYQVNVQPSNVSEVKQTGISLICAASSAPTVLPQFTSQTIYFDLPAGSSPSTFIDNRFTTISFRASTASQGHQWSSIVGGAAVTATETFSYSMPLYSSLVGVTADRFFNIGRTNKLQIALQTAVELPISILCSATAAAAGAMTVTLSDFAIQCQYIDVGPTALAMIDATLPDKKAYIHGTTFKTSSISMPAVAGSQSLLAGIRGSSIKSLFCRFQDGGAQSTTNSINGKYDSKLPMLNSINFNVGGQRLPNNPINPLLNPSRAFRALQMASGSYNNATFQSGMNPTQYAKLAAGGTAQAVTVGATQAFIYNLGSAQTALCQFLYGEDLEVVARRGLMSGLNCNSAPVFVEMNIATAPTNAQILFVHALSDVVYIHDVASGDVQVRL